MNISICSFLVGSGGRGREQKANMTWSDHLSCVHQNGTCVLYSAQGSNECELCGAANRIDMTDEFNDSFGHV